MECTLLLFPTFSAMMYPDKKSAEGGAAMDSITRNFVAGAVNDKLTIDEMENP